jgi:hypothetical protein
METTIKQLNPHEENLCINLTEELNTPILAAFSVHTQITTPIPGLNTPCTENRTGLVLILDPANTLEESELLGFLTRFTSCTPDELPEVKFTRSELCTFISISF